MSALAPILQSFFTDRLTQKVHGTRVHCLTFLTRTSMSRDEHDRDVQLGMTEHVLQFKTIHAGHAHVENQASGIFKVPEGQKLAGRAKGFGCETEGSDQPSGRASDRWVVIDDRYKRVLNCATLAFHDRIFTVRAKGMLLDLGLGRATHFRAVSNRPDNNYWSDSFP